MSVTLHTVDNGTVNAINDAKFYEQLTNAVAGVVAGGVCSAAGGLVVHITSGWGIIKGRLFTIDAEDITVEPSASGTVNGRLKMVIDLTATPNIYFESERARTLPALVQEDLNAGGTVYELALRTYSVGELAVSDLVSNTPISIIPASRADYVAKTDKNNAYFRGNNIITSTANDTRAYWLSLGNGIFYFNQTALTDQPTQYGYLLNIVSTTGTRNFTQLWFSLAGKMYTRVGSSSGWSVTWMPVPYSRDDIAGIVKSNTTSSKTLNMSLSGTTLTITYQ